MNETNEGRKNEEEKKERGGNKKEIMKERW
jgi:hypothetical protein